MPDAADRLRGLYEVVVVGAGPAGAAAALVLARAGVAVALLDRAAFPRDKACGDLLGTWAVRLLRQLRIDPAPFAAYRPLDGAMLYTPGGRTLGAAVRREGGAAPFGRLDALVVPRLEFDAQLVQAARAAGATVATVSATGLLRDRTGAVAGVHGRGPGGEVEVRAPLTIGADGWGSLVARGLGVRRGEPRRVGMATRTYVAGARGLDNRMHFFVGGPGRGYGWVFPLPGGRANVGLGVFADQPGADRLGELFARFLRDPGSPAARFLSGATVVGPAASWPLALGWRGTPLSGAGALLAGDAGWLVSPLSGSGIHSALASGISAARTALRALRAGDFGAAILREHDRRCRRTLGWRLEVEAWCQAWLRDPRTFERFGRAVALVPGGQRLLAPLLLNLG